MSVGYTEIVLLRPPRPSDARPTASSITGIPPSTQAQRELLGTSEYGFLRNADIPFQSETDIITITHAPGPQAQARAKVTALGGLSRLNNTINVFPPSAPQLPATKSASENDRTCAKTYSPAATSSQHLSNSALMDTSSHFSTT